MSRTKRALHLPRVPIPPPTSAHPDKTKRPHRKRKHKTKERPDD